MRAARSSGLRAIAISFAVLTLAVLLDPPGAHSAPGDLVLTKPKGGGAAVGAFATPGDPEAAIGRQRAQSAAGAPAGVAGAPVRPSRRVVPHHFTKPGARPAPWIGSRAPERRASIDVAQRAADLALARDARGPASTRRDVVTSEPGQDLVRIALLRVDFTNDREGANSSGDGRFDLSPRDTTNRPLDPTPHDRAFWQSHGEAIRRYWEAQTNGRTVVEVVVYPSARDSAFHLPDMADYGPWKFSPEIYEAAVKLFHDCVNAADTTETIPWNTFDRVLIVHAGSDLQSDVNQDSPLDIPTFTIGVPDSDAVVVGPARADTIFGAAILPETIRQDGYEGVVNAVIAHELGHLIYGYRDVYDVVSGLPTVGYWSLMDVGNLLGNAITFPSGLAVYATGILPPSVDPWQKRLIYPDVPAARFPTYGQTDVLANSSEGYEVLQVPLSGEEYLLLENRLDDLNGNGSLTLKRDTGTGVILGPAIEDTLEYDYLVPGPGILAWQVDESVADYFGPRADPGFGLNVNRGRFGLEIVEADGLDDLGDFNSPYALGWTTDPWRDGAHSRLNFETIPSLRTNSRTIPHLDLEFLSPPGPTMDVRVSRLWDLPGWPVRVTQPAEGIAPISGDFFGDGARQVAWVGGDGAVHVRNADGSIAIAGAPTDVVFQPAGVYAGVPLGPVALGRVGASPRLVVAQKGDPKLTGIVHVIDLTGVSPVVTDVGFDAAVTAGPTIGNLSSGRVLVGLANGRVAELRLEDHSPREILGLGDAPITGLALQGPDMAAADADGRVGRGRFSSSDPGATFEWYDGAERLADGRALQPLLIGPGGRTRFVVVDRTRGSAREVSCPGFDPLPVHPWQGTELGEAVAPPAVGDFDADGRPEIGFVTASGRVGFWELTGATRPGWPADLEREGFASSAGPLALKTSDGPGASGMLLAPLGNGVTVGVGPDGKQVSGFPLGFSVGTRGTPALGFASGTSNPVLFAAGGDTLLYATSLFGIDPAPSTGTEWLSTWSAEGGTAGRSYAANVETEAEVPLTSAIDEGSIVLYPNPAQRVPITFSFRLREAGPIKVSVYDPSARLVESFERAGVASDNAITWDPVGRSSGLYVARIEAGGQVVTRPFALVR